MAPGQRVLTPGQRVRVAPATADGLARRALVLSVEPDGAGYEIEYEQTEEEDVVATERVSPLLPFEEHEQAPATHLPLSEQSCEEVQGQSTSPLSIVAECSGSQTGSMCAQQV